MFSPTPDEQVGMDVTKSAMDGGVFRRQLEMSVSDFVLFLHHLSMHRFLSSWPAPMQTTMPPCQTMTQTGVEPPFTAPGASSMARCGTALLAVR